MNFRAACASTILLACALLPLPAHAHVGAGETAGFVAGLGHPFGGLDHVFAMFAVGLWAAQRGGRALWLIPAAFVLVMSVAGFAGARGADLPLVEHGIALSVLVLGVLVAAAVRLPLSAGALVVGLFAVFHGHAHGTAMPADAWGIAWGAGLALATAALHALGVALGVAFARLTRGAGQPIVRNAGRAAVRRICGPAPLRFSGGAIAACGAILLLMA